MVSKQIVHMLGLELHVFGLDEYNKLPEGTPLCAMFFSTGVQTPQEYVEKSCQQMCTLNNKRHPNDRYLIMISLDHPNTGSRKLYRDDVVQLTKTINTELIPKMYLHGKSTAYSISLIIESFDLHVFGENSKSYVEKWGVAGFSMGGTTAALSASFDPKIEVVIMMASGLNYIKWTEHMATHLGFIDDFHKRKRAARVVNTGIENYIRDLSNTKLLLLYSDQDNCTCLSQEESAIQTLRQVHNGQEGIDWKYMILPVKGHTVHPVYNKEAMVWTKQWMTSNVQFIQAKI